MWLWGRKARVLGTTAQERGKTMIRISRLKPSTQTGHCQAMLLSTLKITTKKGNRVIFIPLMVPRSGMSV